jgi:hypothetical protein
LGIVGIFCLLLSIVRKTLSTQFKTLGTAHPQPPTGPNIVVLEMSETGYFGRSFLFILNKYDIFKPEAN